MSPASSGPGAVAERLAAVRRRIAEAEARAGRPPGSVLLVAVSKGQDAHAVAAAWRAGQRIFGENRVQEGTRKAAEVAALLAAGIGTGPATVAAGEPSADAPVWHLLGPLQSNKVRPALALFPVLHALDRPSIIEAVDRDARARPGRPPIEAFLEVNVAGEASKHGFEPSALEAFLAGAPSFDGLRLAGLMTVPPYDPDPEASRPWFRRLRELSASLRARGLLAPGADRLSMGMSGDFEAAIEEGATHVRVGTAIFGERSPAAAAR